MSRVAVDRLKEIAEVEFDEIVHYASITGLNELRIVLEEGSFIDVWFSLKLEDRYSYHWERREIDGTLYRHDNAPHRRWRHIATFPKPFHTGSEADDDIEASHLSDDPETAVREFLTFVAEVLGMAGRDDPA